MLLLGEKLSTKTKHFIIIKFRNTPFRGVFLFHIEKTKQELCSLFILSKLAQQNYLKLNKMADPCILFKSQRKKAKETLNKLLIQKAELNSKLGSDYSNAHLQKDLRTINMDIRITENEIEHAEFRIQECEMNLKTLI